MFLLYANIVFSSPIRVFYDLDYLDNNYCRCETEENTSCNKMKCDKEDLVTESTKEKIKYTTDAASAYLKELLSIKKPRNEIQLSQYSDNELFNIYKPKEYINNVDVYIQVAVQSLPGDNRAAFSLNHNDTCCSPYHGIIVLSSKYVNSVEASNSTSTNRELFQTIVHETFHILGLRSSLFKYWINPSTNKIYGSVINMSHVINFRGIKRNFTLINTPLAQMLAKVRFNIEDSVPLGIELEDAGPKGTWSDHLESRIYFGDIMMGLSDKRLSVSDITLALLADTGFYDVNLNMSEPLAWGDSRFFNGDFTETFLYNNPATFPSSYLCTDNESLNQQTKSNYNVCTYDFLGLATCRSKRDTIDCANTTNDEEQYYCDSKIYYNQNNHSYIGLDRIVDWLPTKSTLSLCGKGHRCSIVGSDPTSNGIGVCVKLEKYDSASYTISYNGATATCHSEGEIVNLGDTKLKCDHIYGFSHAEEFYEKTESQLLTVDENTQEGLSGWEISLIVISSCLGVAGTGGVSVVIYIRIGKKDEDDYHKEELLLV